MDNKNKVIMVDSLVGNDYTLCLCSSLSKHGIDVVLIVPENREINIPINFQVKYLAPTKSKGYSKTKKAIKYVKYLLTLLKLIMKQDDKVIHYQFFRNRSESLFFFLLKFFRANMIYTAHNVFPHNRNKIDYLLFSLIYRTADRIIAHSNHIKEELIKNFKIKNEKIQIIPHGNFDVYLPSKKVDTNLTRRSLGLSNNDDVILFFGYIRENKGLDLLLDAFEIASKKNLKLKLVIAGAIQSRQLNNFYQQKISQIKSNTRIVTHIKFIPTEDVPLYFMSSDIVALPYKSIYHSGIVHLAYSFGLPIIATRVGDFEEMTENGKCGYLSDKNDSQSFATAIMTAFSDKKKLKEMGTRAKKLSDTKYSWDEIAIETCKLYEDAAQLKC